ncbi:DNA-binding transcriptional LysR family regulator [Crossiella equi]|uniref:DNA-binding transcriptional LysR family regulator n=1 Tax=Crossiella equi TaxID=130796 RepID=A0ABS5AI42_9PSEU|nr:LysR substrate-binding domain-containing protein [Crossiella equi]MBP2476031.1 DNA-binding transcriptional LysR family regulator [Crossiella equi]
MELEVRHLRVLLAVADAGSVSKAAATLGLSQPSLSAQLRRIERAMGAPLFDRSTEGVAPTSVGRFVLAKARTVLAELDELHAWAGRKSGGGGGLTRVRVGSVPGPIAARLALALQSLYPGELEVHSLAEQSSFAMLGLLGGRRMDLAVVEEFSGHELPTVAGVRRAPLVAVEPVFVAVADTHPLAGEAVIDLADLAEEPWIVDPLVDSGETAHLRRRCLEAGFEPLIRHHATETSAARGAVSSGLCVSLAQATAREGLGLVVRPLRGDPLVRRLDVAWAEGRAGHRGPGAAGGRGGLPGAGGEQHQLRDLVGGAPGSTSGGALTGTPPSPSC